MRQACLYGPLLCLAVATCPVAAAEVIAHAGHAGSDISRPLLRGVFGMRVRAWPNGTPVRVFVLEDGNAVHQEFSKTLLQMYPYQLRQNWDRLVYSGTGQQPVTVPTEEELLRRVAETPGAIGYLSRYPLDPRSKGQAALPVKVLDVQ